MWKQLLSSYFAFSKKERSGIFTLLILILLFTALPLLYPLLITSKTTDAAAFKKDIATLTIKQQDSTIHTAGTTFDQYAEPAYYQPAEKTYGYTAAKATLFYFDPNTITTEEWQRLGVRDKTIATIKNYLSKGGHFYKPEDIGKIWGLHPDEVQRLLPYVQIAAKESNAVKKEYEPALPDKPKKSFTPIDINSADTTALIALPGIGSKLAQRIINFRDKLGGFYSTEQVAETFGLPDSTFQKIKPRLAIGNSPVKQLNINTAGMAEMKAHPYLRYTIANAIVQFRTQHGNFTSVADLKKIVLVTEELYTKMAPYLTVQ